MCPYFVRVTGMILNVDEKTAKEYWEEGYTITDAYGNVINFEEEIKCMQ